MRVLAVTTEPITADALREALPEDIDPSEVEVMVVAPALHAGALRFWVSDADEAIERADAVRRQSVDQLDALRTFPADRIVLFVHPEGERRYREDADEGDFRERFGLPVDRAEISSGSD